MSPISLDTSTENDNEYRCSPPQAIKQLSSLIQARPTFTILIISAANAIIVIFVLAITHSAFTPYSHLLYYSQQTLLDPSSSPSPSSFSSFFNTASTSSTYKHGQDGNLNPRSGWFHGGGFLRLDPGDVGAKSVYDVLLKENETPRWDCDQLEPLGSSGTLVCKNNLKITTSIRRNLWLQKYLLNNTREDNDNSNNNSDDGAGGELYQSRVDELKSTGDYLSFLSGKRILMLGDSVDRNSITSLVHYFDIYHFHEINFTQPLIDEVLASMAQKTDDDSNTMNQKTRLKRSKDIITNEKRNDFSIFDLKYRASALAAEFLIASERESCRSREELADNFNTHYDPSLPDISKLFRIDFGFVYGSTVKVKWRDNPPYENDERIACLQHEVNPISPLKLGDKEYDAIFLNFGLWDIIEINSRAYIAGGDNYEYGAPSEFIQEYKEAVTKNYNAIKKQYPGTPIIFRLVHDIWNVPYMKSPRAKQFRDTQIVLAKELGAGVHPFAMRIAGWPSPSYIREDGVHPEDHGSALYMEILFRMLKELHEGRSFENVMEYL